MIFTPAAICFCPADYDDKEQNDRQLRAWELWQLVKSVGPIKIGLYLPCTTERDKKFAEEYFATDTSRPFLLERSAQQEFGRPLPFVRDLMCCASFYGCIEWRSHFWIGFFNNDILVTPGMARAIAGHSDLDTVLVHRTDIDDAKTLSNAKVDRASVDGWLIKENVWHELETADIEFPDFMLGEPGWGYASTLWCTYHKLTQYHLEGLCHHVLHRGVWKKRKRLPRHKNRALWYGQDLYKRLEERTGLRMDQETGRAVPKE